MSVEKYRVNVPKAKFAAEPRSVVWRAMIDFIVKTDDDKMPDRETINALRSAFIDVMSGEDARVAFKPGTKGRPKARGFTRADIVSAFIEQRRRAIQAQQGGPKNALTQAKWAAQGAFVDLAGEDVEREIERCWKNGRATVKGLSDAELAALLEPHRV